MKIVLNGAEMDIAAAMSLQDLLEHAGFAQKRIAVELNREIVPRSTYAQRSLQADDRIEIVHAIGGG